MEPTSPLPQPEPPPAPSTSLAGRLFNVFTEPGEVFEEVKHSPPSAANWVAPALILILVSWIGGWLIFSQESITHQLTEITDQAIQKQIDQGHIPKEQAERIRETAAKWATLGPRIGAIVVPVFAGFATPFWGGLILWLLGAKLFKGSFPFMKAVEVAGLANMVGILDAIIRTLLIVKTGNLYASPSLMLLVKQFDPQNPAHLALGAVNVMTLWLVAVRSIGLVRLCGTSFAKAFAWLFGIALVFSGLGIGYAALMQVLTNR